MSEDRETPASRAAETPDTPSNPGAPVEESEASRTEVLRAVERSRASGGDGSAPLGEPAAAEGAAGSETAGGAAAEVPAKGAAGAEGAALAAPVATADADADEAARRRALSEVDTELDMDVKDRPARTALDARIAELEELPSAAGEPATPVRDGEIRISADHPMAALYMQTPMPPEIRGNRGAGVLIALLGTVGFALVYAGVLALWLAPSFAPSQFVANGLVPWLTSWVYIAAVAAFFVGLTVLVLILGRAGWWAYVLGGFFVAVLVWFAAAIAGALTGGPWSVDGEPVPPITFDVDGLRVLFQWIGSSVPVLGAAVVAREATVWFGAWIGARGRRMKRRNAEALAEYEAALAEVQAQRP